MSSVASLGLVAFGVRCATRQTVCSSGNGLQGFTQGANSVIDVAFSPGVFVRDASGSLPMDRHVLLCFRGFGLDFWCAATPSIRARTFRHELLDGC